MHDTSTMTIMVIVEVSCISCTFRHFHKWRKVQLMHDTSTIEIISMVEVSCILCTFLNNRENGQFLYLWDNMSYNARGGTPNNKKFLLFGVPPLAL